MESTNQVKSSAPITVSQPRKIRTQGLRGSTSKNAKASGHLRLASASLTILPPPQQLKKKKKATHEVPSSGLRCPPLHAPGFRDPFIKAAAGTRAGFKRAKSRPP